jgi:hypothetical protein
MNTTTVVGYVGWARWPRGGWQVVAEGPTQAETRRWLMDAIKVKGRSIIEDTNGLPPAAMKR